MPYAQADLARHTFGSLINGIVDDQPRPLPYANFGQTPIALHAGQVIGILEECPCSPPEHCEIYLGLAEVFEGLPPVEEGAEGAYPDGYPYLVQQPQSSLDIDKANVSEHWGTEKRQEVLDVIQQNAPLFRNELGCFNDGVEMPIPFKNGADVEDLKQVPYSLSIKDRRAMDEILDPLKDIGVVEDVPLGKPSPVSSPAFVVWKDGKPRVVVDLRRVNSKLYVDAYPLPKQDDILTAMHGSEVFSVLDMTKSFFQQKICPGDRWKTAFVSPHRGQEQLTVSTMGLASSPSFFQHRMEQLFGKYLWKFVLVYIDDTIIFSKDIDSHIRHLSTVLRILCKSGATLSLAKCFFAQPGLRALGHFVSRLGLSTVEQKVEAVRALAFPTNLQELEHGLGFFGYYRKFVPYFAAIARPLQILKTRGFKGVSVDKKIRKAHAIKTKVADVAEGSDPPDTLIARCKEAWETLKEKLCSAPTLAFPNFDRPFILYVDGSRERGYGVALHQEDLEGVERPILFLSKELNPTEENYWPSELETGALVWALEKLPQYLDHGKMTVYTDHSSLRDAFKDQGPVRGKRSLRLANWRLFLSKYQDRMEIRHRPGKQHINADALSRMPTEESPVEESPTLLVPASVRTWIPARSNAKLLPEQNVQLQHAYPVRTRRMTAAPLVTTPDATEPTGDSLEPMPPSPQDRSPSPNDTDASVPEQRSRPAFPLPDDVTATTVPDRTPELLHDPQNGLPIPDEVNTDVPEPVPLPTGPTPSGNATDSEPFHALHVHPGILKAIARQLPSDKSLGKIYSLLVRLYNDTKSEAGGPRTTFQSFRRDPKSKLLFFLDGDRERLCIPLKSQRKVFEAAHDNRAHVGGNRVYYYLREHIFFPKMRKRILEYVTNCPTCQGAKPKRIHPWGDLHPIPHPDRPLSVLCFDFVDGLPLSTQGNDKLLTITCKSTKYIKSIPGQETWTAEDWANAFFVQIYGDWGFPDQIISDRDSKFLSRFWGRLFQLARVDLAFTTAHHSAADGQSERTNQTLTHALRCALGGTYDQSSWEDLLPFVQIALNTSINASTGETPYQLLYGREAKAELGVPNRDEDNGWIQRRIDLRNEAADAVKLAQARMKIYYDEQHSVPHFDDYAYLRLSKKNEKGYHLENQTKLSFNKIGPFRILRAFGNLAYEIELPDWLKGMHPVISVEHLEPAPPDPYHRHRPDPGPIHVDGEERYIIDKILSHETRRVPGQRRGIWYQVKWLGYEATTWEPRSSLLEQVPRLLKAYHDDARR
jgi:hypothetical protein